MEIVKIWNINIAKFSHVLETEQTEDSQEFNQFIHLSQ